MRFWQTALSEINTEGQRVTGGYYVVNVMAALDVLLHAFYLALFLALKPDPALLAFTAAGLAACAVAFALNYKRVIREDAACAVLVIEVAVISVASMAFLGFGGLLYCHLLCAFIPNSMVRDLGGHIYRALGVFVFLCIAACAVVGLTVAPLAGDGHLNVFAASALITVFAVRYIESLLDRRYISRSIAGYEKSIAGVKDESMTDPLTGLWNRRYLYLNAEKYMSMADSSPCSVAMLDLDWFKTVNDRHSHIVGDQMLLYFSTFLKKNLRASDHIVRWGGEEFLIIFTNTDVRQAAAVLNNLREDFKALPMPVGDAFIPMSFTAGVGALRAGASMQAAIEAADTLLYAGKNGGRDRVVSSE